MSQTQVANVTFHGQQLITAKSGDQIVVAMKPIVENIGLQWEAQYKRINRHPVLKTSMSMMDIQMPGDDQKRQVTMLPLKMLNGWLFGVDANRVKPECRDKAIQYQEECFDALYNYWNAGIAINQNLTITPAQQSDLQAIVATISPDGRRRGEVWTRFNRHFRIAKYNQLAQAKFEEAKQYLKDSFLNGEYIEHEVDIRHVLTSGMSEPTVQLSDEIESLIRSKAITEGINFADLFMTHMKKRIAYQCEYGHPRRVVDEEKAKQIIAESSIDSALSGHYYGLLKNVQSMSESLIQMTQAYSRDISKALGKTSTSLVA